MHKQLSALAFAFLVAVSGCAAQPQADSASPPAEAQRQFEQAVRLRNGHGVTQDIAEALRLFEAAAAAGHIDAALQAGEIHFNGRGVPVDRSRARAIWERAAQSGSSFAMFNLGVMYAVGAGVPRDDAMAARWWQMAAERGQSSAQNNLATLYASGTGVPRDRATALKWWGAAAAQGEAAAMMSLGKAHAEGAGVPADPVTASMWWRRAAALLPPSETVARQQVAADLARIEAGMSRDQIEAADRRARDWKPSRLSLMVVAPNATGSEALDAARRGDFATAHRIWETLANNGDAMSRFNLGLLYLNGHGVPRDPAAAVRHFRIAADSGEALSQYTLGLMSMTGKDVPMDLDAAERWLKAAASRRYVPAMNNLGALYSMNQRGQPDLVEAYKWFLLAAGNAAPDAAEKPIYARNLAILETSMSAQQIETARARAAAWRPGD